MTNWYTGTATLEILQETKDEAFKAYMTSKIQGWFRGWGCTSTSAAAVPRPLAPPPPHRDRGHHSKVGSTFFTYEKCLDIFYTFHVLFTYFTYEGS
jgi:hypothetical protein